MGDAPQLGTPLTLRAVVELGGLSPDDVEVQAAYGRVDEADVLHEPTFVQMRLQDQVDGQYRYGGVVPLDRTGAFGYTVRARPHHPLLAGPAELGLVVTA